MKKNVLPVPLAFMVTDLLSFEVSFSYRWGNVFLSVFKIFSLCLVFRSLAVMSGMVLWFIPLGFTLLLESVGLCLLPSLGNFQRLLLHMPDFNDTNFFYLLFQSQRFLRLCSSSFQSVFSRLFRLESFCSIFFVHW